MKLELLALALGTVVPVSLTTAQQFVVANRGSADITVFDRDGQVDQTVSLPAATNIPDPMYVVQVGNEVVVGDRANDRVVRFSKTDYAVLGTVPVGNGVFHMWSNGRQLWVNNDVDNTTSVIDTRTWSVVHTVPMPVDLVAQGYKPHDVFVSGRFGYVSLLGGTGADDWVVQFSVHDFAERNRAAVGGDPHLWHDAWSRKLFVASQESGEVQVLDDESLAERRSIAMPNAHGIYVPRWSRTMLVTNIAAGGVDGLGTAHIRIRGALRAGEAADTPSPTPHNIAAASFGSRIFVTHSGGASTKVSIYRLRGWFGHQRLEFLREVDAGLNPFGLAVVR